MEATREPRPLAGTQWPRPGIYGTVCAVLGGLLVFVGAFVGVALFPRHADIEWLESLVGMDGVHYRSIVELGYENDPYSSSSVAFFPVFPAVSRVVARFLPTSPAVALLLVANVMALAALSVWASYLKSRDDYDLAPTLVAGGRSTFSRKLALWATALVPTGFFWHVAYSEATLLAFLAATLLAIKSKWPPPAVALLAGAATGARPVGVAIVPVVVIYCWTYYRSWQTRIGATVVLAPIAAWGLIAYMALLRYHFGDALAFAHTQAYWNICPGRTGEDKWISLLSLEPLWSVYVPGNEAYWLRDNALANPLLNVQFLNPIYFVGTAALVLVGAWKNWLNGREIVLSAGLLFIPYVTRCYETCAASHARFASVVLPAYIVAGQLLARMPRTVAIGLLILSGSLMGVYSALFAAGYSFY